MDRPTAAPATDALAALAIVAAAVVAALLLAGCGGGDGPVPRAAREPAAASALVASPAPAAAATVQLTGCVVDEMFIPRSDVPVRALAADGRLLGNAQSDTRGAFRLQVPARQTVSLAVDRAGGESLKVASGQHSRALTTCLLDPSA